MVGVGIWEANYVLIDDILVTSGGVFGPGFNSDDIVRTKVGSLALNFPSCQADSRPGKLAFQAGPGSGLEDLLVNATRLSNVLNCSVETAPGLSNIHRSGPKASIT